MIALVIYYNLISSIYCSSSKLNSTDIAFWYLQLADIHSVMNGMSSMYCSSSKEKFVKFCSDTISL